MVPTPEQLAEANIHVFLDHYDIKNEQGLPMEFKDRSFLWDIFEDESPLLAVLKAPQIGLTTLMTIKSLWVAKNRGKDIIYTLPTKSDVNDMAGGKINRIIAQNAIFQEWVKDHDSVESKRVGNQTIYYRGTFTNKQAMMVSSQLNIHDEVDASDQGVMEQYETRLQAQKGGMRWYFSHPSLPDYGIDKYWQISDQKHWFIKCPHCKKQQYLSWPDSLDLEKRCFVCKECKEHLSDEDRRKGRWVARFPNTPERPFSGYWVSQLMCPWITAEKIIQDFHEKTPEYFANYVLGLPYLGGDAKLTQQQLFQNLSGNLQVPETDERVVIGVDTGLRLDIVMGNQRLGLFYQGDAKDYKELDNYMLRWPNAVVVMDAGGDLIGSRAFHEKWRGRVFLAYAGEDKKDNELVRYGEKDKVGSVIYDLNRMWQLCVDEFREHRIPLQGEEGDWWEYWLDWKNMSRIKVYDPKTDMLKGIKWVRNGRNHRASATLFWRIGMMRFSQNKVEFLSPNAPTASRGYEQKETASFL